MSTTLWIVLAVVNIPVYCGLGWVLFRDWEDFGEAIRFWFTPDVFSMFRDTILRLVDADRLEYKSLIRTQSK